MRLLIRTCVVGVVVAAVLAGCSGSGSSTKSETPDSVIPVANPLDPGHGFLQLGGTRYPFEGVVCARGKVKSDDPYTNRVFGVYANFKAEGTLYAISLTRYDNHPPGSVPTLSETALVQMQGVGEVKGAKAQRVKVQGQTKWKDVFDPSATEPLISHEGDRYSAIGSFGPPDQLDHKGVGILDGEITARCPAKSDTSATTSTPATTAAPATTGAG